MSTMKPEDGSIDSNIIEYGPNFNWEPAKGLTNMVEIENDGVYSLASMSSTVREHLTIGDGEKPAEWLQRYAHNKKLRKKCHTVTLRPDSLPQHRSLNLLIVENGSGFNWEPAQCLKGYGRRKDHRDGWETTEIF
uniref:Uncharacterized protein n=1 Tax=Pristionchus pacificus TaxID=54126 RepID=A0A2A6C0I0_PRIPA|eukprot:PDM71650.1 hypothetical protein PRIPAC_38057 [Pristionchus pacificus]